MNAKLILVAMAFALVCISAKPRAPVKEYLKSIQEKNDQEDRYQIFKRASCHCSDDQGDYRDTQWNTGTEFWGFTCAYHGWKDCDPNYGAFTNCCREG